MLSNQLSLNRSLDELMAARSRGRLSGRALYRTYCLPPPGFGEVGMIAFEVEVIETRLDALACVRPCLLGHMGPGIPHLHTLGDRGVMHALPGLRAVAWLPLRRDPCRGGARRRGRR